MRALVLSIAALVAVPTLALAQARTGISQNPWATETRRPVAPAVPRHDGYDWHERYDGFDGYDGYDGYEGYERRGGGHRSRPVVIVVSPYDAYGIRRSGAYLDSYGGTHVGSSNTTYTGTYASGALRAERDEASDTTYIAYVPSRRDEALRDEALRDEAPYVIAASPAAISLAVERVGTAMLRLHWTGRDAQVRAVTLVVADASRRVLAAQTVRVAPYSAVFDNGGRIAFVGTTLLRADGTRTTTLVPVGRIPNAAARKPLPPIRRSPG